MVKPPAEATQPQQPTPPAQEVLCTLCNEAEGKLEQLIHQAQAYEQQLRAINQTLSALYSDIQTQRGYVSGLRIATGKPPLPTAR